MPAGRPPKLTPRTLKAIVNVILGGNYAETAAAIAGIDRNTFTRWLKRGAKELDRLQTLWEQGDTRAKPEKSERLFVELCSMVERASAAADARDLAKLDALGQGGLEEGHEVTRTKRSPVIVEGKQLLDKEGLPVFLTETTIERRSAKSLPSVAALTWRLERRNRKHFGRHVRLEATGVDGSPLIPMSAILAVLEGLDEADAILTEGSLLLPSVSQSTSEQASDATSQA